jgi:spore germination protein
VKSSVEPISPSQFFWLALISVVAGGVYLWPSYLFRVAGTAAWYSLLVTLVVAATTQALSTSWSHRLGRSPYVAGLTFVWHSFGSWVILPLGALLCFSIDAILLSLFGQMLKTFFYPITPRVVSIGAMALVATWIGMRSLTTVARNVQFWVPLIFVTFIVIIVMAWHDVQFPTAVTPATDIPLVPVLRGSIGTWFLYASGGLTASLVPHVRWHGTPRPVLLAVAATLLQGVALLVLGWVVAATLGPDPITHLVWPIIYVFGLVRVRGFFLEGLGLLIILVWTSALILYLAVHIFCVSWNFSSLIGAPEIHRWVAVGVGLLVACAAVLISTPILGSQLLFGFVSPADMAWSVLFIPANYVISSWRMRTERRPQ